MSGNGIPQVNQRQGGTKFRAIKRKGAKMKESQIIPMFIFAAMAFIYLWSSTGFNRGWTRKCIAVKGGRINVLLFIFVVFVVLAALVKTTM
jgi:hypothetical protein